MKRIAAYMLFIAICTSCYHDIDLENYRGKEMVVLNSIVTPDTVVMADISRTWFFTDTEPAKDITDLTVKLYINSQLRSVMEYNGEKYISKIYPKEGDTIRIQTQVDGQTVTAEEVVPTLVRLKDLHVSYRLVPTDTPSYWTDGDGNITIIDKENEFTYKITFQDEPNKKNYYFVRVQTESNSQSLGTLNYAYDPVFQILSEQINGSLTSQDINGQLGLPFSDQGIDGKEYTLTIKETGPDFNYTGKHCYRRVRLYSISESYYRYLVSLQSNDSDQTLQGGMADIGIAEPVPIYTNIKGGTGILGCQQQEYKLYDLAPFF